MVRYWMHNGLMKAAAAAGKVGGKSERDKDQADVDTKISRSKGAGGLAELIQQQGGERLRFFLLRTHYRSTIVFGDDALAEAGTALDSFYRFFERVERVAGEDFYGLVAPDRRSGEQPTAGDDKTLSLVAAKRALFIEKMDDDFNTGAAVSELFELVRLLNKFIDDADLEDAQKRTDADIKTLRYGAITLKELSGILGLFQHPPAAAAGNDALVDDLMQLLIKLRASARDKKDFDTADQIRNGLTELGITLEDRKDGTGWKLS